MLLAEKEDGATVSAMTPCNAPPEPPELSPTAAQYEDDFEETVDEETNEEDEIEEVIEGEEPDSDEGQFKVMGTESRSCGHFVWFWTEIPEEVEESSSSDEEEEKEFAGGQYQDDFEECASDEV